MMLNKIKNKLIRVYRYLTATRLRKFLSGTLAILIVITSIRYVLVKPAETEAAWYNESWKFRTKITVDDAKVGGANEIFDDGNEDGTLNDYTNTSLDSGDLSVSASAALGGTNYGLSLLVDDNTTINVQERAITQSTTFSYRFYIDPNSITMSNGDQTNVNFLMQNAGSYLELCAAYLKYETGEGYRIQTYCYNDAASAVLNVTTTITDAPHYVEFRGVRAATSGSSDGSYQAWIDGTSVGTATSVDNYNAMADQEWRAILQADYVDTGTRGTFYLDEFVLNDDGSYIGPVLTDFPVYVDLSLLPSGFHSHVNQTDAGDIRVTKADGVTELPREIVYYDSNNNTGELHFKSTGTINSTTDTSFYIYYGNPSANDYAATDTYGSENVWDSNFAQIQHFDETSGNQVDSTTNDLDSDTVAVTTQGGNVGKLNRAYEFDGDADYTRFAHNDLLTPTGDMTIEAWVKLDVQASTSGHHNYIAFKGLSASPWQSYILFVSSGDDKARFRWTNTSGTDYYSASASTISANTWYHLTAVKSGSYLDFYLNGNNVGSTTTTSTGTIATANGTYMRIGNDSTNAYDLDGVIDETRISNVVRSSIWIYTQYNNQNDPQSFFTASSSFEEEAYRAAIVQLSFDEGYGTTTNDNSPNNHDGTLSGSTTPSWQSEDLCVSGKCLYYNGSTAYTSIATSVANVQSVSFWVNPKTNGEVMVDFDGGTHRITASSGTISATGFSSPTIYVNGTVNGPLVANSWQNVTVTTATSFTASNITIGKYSSSYLNGFIDEFKVYDYVRSASQTNMDYVSRNSPRGVSAQFGPNTGFNLSSGLIGYWKMEETATPSTDSSGNGLSGTWNGSTSAASGKFGSGTTYDGTGDYISLGTSSLLDLATNFTYSAWIKPTAVSGTQFLYSSGSTDQNYWGILISSNKLTFYEDAGAVSYSANSDLVAGVWTHVAVVKSGDDGANISFYVNGISDGTATVGTTQSAGTKAISVRSEGGDYYYTGVQDEVRIYNRILSPADISRYYSWAPGPIGHWKMNENTGTTTNDSSGNGYVSNTFTNNTSWTTGKYGSGLLFDGTNDSVAIADNTAFTIGTTNKFTVESWFYPKSLSTGDTQVIVAKRLASNYEWSLFVTSSGQVGGSASQSTGSGYLSCNNSSALPSINTWYHLAFTVDIGTNTLTVYQNGVPICTDTSTTGSLGGNGTATVKFGEDGDGLYDANGIIDDVRIYNYDRSPAQVVEDMNGGHPAPGSPVGSAVAYFKFDEGYETTAYDSNRSTGGAEDLTLSTASWTNNGKLGQAWNGDGTKWVLRTNDSDLDFGASESFTVAGWFKSDNATNPTNGTEYLVSTSAGNTDVGYQIYAKTDGTVCFAIDDDGTWSDVESCSTTDYYDATWHHFAAVRNVASDTIKIYIDGSQKDSDTDTTTASLDGNNVFYIGDFDGDNNATTGTEEFAGDIDEVSVFRSALEPDQIKVVINNGSISSLGFLSTDSSGNPSNSAQREYCPPGNTEGNCGSGDPTPVGHWKLDENNGGSAYDISGNNGTGTITGADWSPGKLGSSLLFNADDDVSIADADRFSIPTTGELTVTAWVNINDAATGGYVVTKYQTGQIEWSLRINADETPRAAIHDSVGGLYLGDNFSEVLTLNKWYHVAFTVNSSTPILKFYINGVLIAEDTTTGGSGILASNGTSPVSFGEDSSGGNDLEGLIDDVRIYNYVRTPAQIKWDMNQGKPALHWRFDENSGSPTTLYDTAETSLNGTANGSMDSSDWVSGKLNTGLDFDGSDDVINRANSTYIDLNLGLSQGFTFSTWIYPNTVGETAGRIFQKGSNGSTTDSSTTFCRVTGSTPFGIECNLDLDTTDAVYSVASAAPANTWTHIAFSWTNDSDDEVTIWVNGVPSTSSATYSGSPTAEALTLFVGGNGLGASNTRAFDGILDDFRIYSYELSSQQIKSLMNNGSVARFAPVTGTP